MATTGCIPAMARPEADVSACCSAMPTSKNRSGWALPNFARPVGPAMAAVMAAMSSRSSPSLTSSSENTEVQSRTGLDFDLPVTGSITPVACIRSASLASAGAKPRPLCVFAWTMTGPPNSRAWRSAFSSDRMLCPSTGPMYFRPRSENISCGMTVDFRPSFAP